MVGVKRSKLYFMLRGSIPVKIRFYIQIAYARRKFDKKIVLLGRKGKVVIIINQGGIGEYFFTKNMVPPECSSGITPWYIGVE